MDERSLIAAEPADVMRRMAEAFLAVPQIDARLGEVRLAPHQVDAASRLLTLLGDSGGGVLADATGLGKTFVAIAVARVLGPALFVAPAALRGMWRDALGRTGVEARFESYEALSRGHVPDRAALLVMDEAHHARNPRARRYAALADLAWGARVLLLTATPIHNRGRDLRALIALFAGSRAASMPDEEIRRLVVRRTAGSWSGSADLPTLGAPRWLDVPSDRETLRAIKALPPAVPVSDGAPAHALLVLGLIRAWSSSVAALAATLRRRLRRAAALAASLEAGRLPDRRELGSWPVVDDAIQLGFPELFAANQGAVDIVRLRETLDAHVSGVRAILQVLDVGRDEARMKLLKSLRDAHAPTPIVAFSQFADTASAAFHGCAGRGGVALVTGRGARIASGRVTTDEIVRGFDVAEARANAMPLDLLIATDVLSEGLSLRRAGVIVHLDLPWTIARLEQRVGRLRRPGSKHRSVAIYAIGPPVSARELVSVVRALQRKARLASAVTGIDELGSALPLLGQRLTKAIAMISERGDTTATEELRRLMRAWLEGQQLPKASVPTPVALALVAYGQSHRLLTIIDGAVSENPAEVLRAAQAMSAGTSAESAHSLTDESAATERWLAEQRSHAIAQPAIENPSTAHADVLRALQQVLAESSRTERPALVRRVERCRELVLSTRGIGAEFALRACLTFESTLDLDRLENTLGSRASVHDPSHGKIQLMSLLTFSPESGTHAFTAHRNADCRVQQGECPRI